MGVRVIRASYRGLVAALAPISFAFASHGQQLSADSTAVLTQIDASATREQLQTAFGPDAVQHLVALSLDPTFDFGMRLRAIRALPLFCPPTSCAGSEVHLALQNVINSNEAEPAPGLRVLRLRAAIEALAKANTGDGNDVALLVPFLSNGSRDLRAATARALGELCDPQAIPPLRARVDLEQVPQVQFALTAALAELAQCP